MTGSIGFIGAGHIAGYMVQGLRAGGFEGAILLSPRNAAHAASLAGLYDCRVADSNQAVVDGAEAVILSVRPAQAAEALGGLVFRDGQLLISACAIVKLEALRALAPAARVIRSMPVSCAAIGASPTTIWPDDTEARAIFEMLGTVRTMPDEAIFEAAGVNGAIYAMLFGLMDQLVRSNEEAGLPAAEARDLVLRSMEGAARMALDQGDTPLGEIIDSLATEGGLTAQGLDVLREQGALDAWGEAYDAILARVTRP